MEVTNRMECLMNEEPEICMKYCDEITGKIFSFTHKDTWLCYEKYHVPLNLYGKAKCRILWNDLAKNSN